ncbi:glycosyltransferase family 4 protein, partial [Patescibacteria group bacterium]|nr:glycosyltransferase family 4 protein [Patescibacteria group bacterium]
VIFCAGLRSNKVHQKGVKIIRFPRQLARFSIFLTTAPTILLGYFVYRLLGNKVDIIHGHGHLPIYFHMYKYLFGWLDKTPYYLHLHITAKGREEELGIKNTSVGFWTKNFEWPLHKLSDYLGVRVANKIFCVSESVKEEAQKYYGADPSKTYFLGSGVNMNLFKPVNRKMRRGKTVLFSGTLVGRKNPDLVIKALKYLPKEYRVVFAGAGNAKGLNELAEREKVFDRVRFINNISYRSMPFVYQTSDIFVMPSNYEGYPKVVLEALSCGKPALVSGFKISKEIERYTFPANRNPKDLAEQIKNILKKTPVVDKETIENIEQNFSWNALARKLDSYYKG